ncbi:MAG TPA: RNA polymerase sigma factor [Acidimicrobiales bacterium]|jgi:RNA polymerase sigma-70 factor (ECF subfamily)|nr:RNA polymerase sigma factor [Acidimicrobiales bacterium]
MVTLNDRLAADLDKAFEAFVRAHQDAVYATALRLTSPADADDVAQETFVRAYKSLTGFEPERILALAPRPWLARITVNVCRNRARDNGRRPRTTVFDQAHASDPADPAAGPDIRAEQADGAAALAVRLAALPDRYRVPVVLRHAYGLSYDEVAEALDRPVGTVKAQVSRALQQLKESS